MHVIQPSAMAALTTAPTALAGVAPDLEQSLQRMYRSSSESVVCGRCATSVTLQTSVTLRTQDLRKAAPLISFASTHHKRRAKPNRGKRNVGGEYQESSLLKVRGNDVIADHRA